MIELLFVLAAIAVLSAIAVPTLVGARERSARAACDGVYTSISSEILNELGTVAHGRDGHPSCGDMGTPWSDVAIIRCITGRHDERNPRARDQRMLVNYVESTQALGSCQVGLDEDATMPDYDLSIVVRQVPTPHAAMRSYAVDLGGLSGP